MLYAITENNVNLLGLDGNPSGNTVDKKDIVFLVMSCSSLKQSQLNYLFSNKACNTFGYQTDKSIEKIGVDWDLFNEAPLKGKIIELSYGGACQYFQDKDEGKYLDRKAIRMAECLIEDRVPMTMIEAIIVQNKETKQKVDAILSQYKYSFKDMVLLKPDCYY